MICTHCGGENPGRARFCNHCGGEAPPAAPTADASVPRSEGEPVVVLRPVFVPGLCLATTIPLTLFLTLWAGGFFGGFSQVAIGGLGLQIPSWLPFVFFGGLAFFGLPYLAYNAQRKTYARTEYRFFADRLEYAEGFFNVEEKTIPYANVTEVALRKGVLQRKHGLGTVVLATPATGASTRSGIRISDVEDPDEVYRRVRSLVEEASRREWRRAA